MSCNRYQYVLKYLVSVSVATVSVVVDAAREVLLTARVGVAAVNVVVLAVRAGVAMDSRVMPVPVKDALGTPLILDGNLIMKAAPPSLTIFSCPTA